MEARRLGRTDIRISPIGLGCWQLSRGRGLVGSYWKNLDQEEIDAIVKASLEGRSEGRRPSLQRDYNALEEEGQGSVPLSSGSWLPTK